MITSAAYGGAELSAEIGRLPPSFLPIGNKRLYELQNEVARMAFDRIVLSLPDDFDPTPFDQRQLAKLGVDIVEVPVGLRLGESIVFALNMIGLGTEPVSILHGDTLFPALSNERPDVISIHDSSHPYPWAVHVDTENGSQILDHDPNVRRENTGGNLSGFFSFSSCTNLIQSITKCGGDFIKGLNYYSEHHAKLEPLRSLGEWLDFGHVQTFYSSRHFLTTQRSFNNLTFSEDFVEKSGDDATKIEAEAKWLQEIPQALKLHTPLFLDFQSKGDTKNYRLSKEYLLTLSDLFVFGRLGIGAWSRIFDACDEFLTKCKQYGLSTAKVDNTDHLYLNKSLERLEIYCSAAGIEIAQPWRINGEVVPGLGEIAQHAASRIVPYRPDFGAIMHGDFCFSNIFYDFRLQRIKVIDPRGFVDRTSPSIYGDQRYDIGKLHHSVIGLYDFITAGWVEVEQTEPYSVSLTLPHSPYIEIVQEEFLARTFSSHRANDGTFLAMSILLFLSMLPLHADSSQRQMGLLANALRLYVLLVETDTR